MKFDITSSILARTQPVLKYNGFLYPFARLPLDIRLRDGWELRLRELRFEDRELLKAFFDRCSPESIRYRFLSPIKSLSDALLDFLADSDGLRHVALILTRRVGDHEMIVAEGRCVVHEEQPVCADVALLAADDWRRRGIATLLIHELIEIGCRNGVSTFTADMLWDNKEMTSLLWKTFHSMNANFSSGVMHFEIPLTCCEALLQEAA